MQRDPGLTEPFHRARKCVVEKDRQRMLDDGAGRPQASDKGKLAGAVGRQIIDQQNAQSLDRTALHLRVATDAKRTFADIAQAEPGFVGEPGRQRNTRRFGTRDHIESARQHGRHILGHELCDCAPNRRLADQQTAIDIDRTGPTGGENERLLPADIDRVGLYQKTRNVSADFRDFRRHQPAASCSAAAITSTPEAKSSICIASSGLCEPFWLRTKTMADGIP